LHGRGNYNLFKYRFCMSVMEPHTEKLKYIFDNARVGIAICNAEDNTLEMVNPAFADIHGYKPHELIGLSPGDVFAPECMLRLSEYESASACAIDDVAFETTHIKKDGSIVPVSVHITVIKGENGVIKQRIANVIDISDRKKTESKLYAASERFSQIYDNSIDVIYLIGVTPGGRFIHLDINPAYTEASGMSRDTIVGRYVDEFENETFRTILLDKYNSCLKARVKTDYINDYPFLSGIKTFHSVLTPLFDETGRIYQIVGIARDITEQKRMEIALEARENEFRSLAENLPDNIARWDTEGRYLYINPVHERTLGKSASEVIGTFIPEAHEAVKTAVAQVAVSGEKRTVAQTATLKDGSMVYHEVSIAPERDTSGKIISILGIGRDITERKQMETALKARELEFRSLAENSPNIIMRYDLDCRRLYVNPAFSKDTGIPLELAIHAKPDTQWDSYMNMVTMSASEYQKKIQAVMRSGESANFLTELFRHIDGGYKAHDVHIIAERDSNGKIIGALVIGHDITEQKRIQEELATKERDFRTIAEHTRDTIARYDAQCIRTYANGAFIRLAGKSAEELLGKKPTDYYCTPQSMRYEEALLRVFKSGREEEFEYTWPDATGSMLTSLIHIVPEKDVYGKVQTVLATGRSITKLKEIEAQLIEQNRFLESLLNAIPVPIFLKDKETRYKGFNKAFEEFYGKNKEELIGKGVFDLFSHEQAQVYFDADAELYRHGGTQIYEAQLKDARGVDHTVMFHKALYFDEAGVAMGQIGTVLDITERKQQELQLLQKEEEFRTLVENMPDNIIRYNRSCQAIYVSQGMKRIYGDDAEAILMGKTPKEANKDFSWYVEEYQYTLEHVLDTGEAKETILAIPSPTGEMLHAQIRFVAERNQAGEIYSVLAIGSDITERKRAEEALKSQSVLLQSVLESSPDVTIFALDREYNYLSFNQNHSKVIYHIWGHKIAVGMNMLDAITCKDDKQKAKKLFDKALAGECFVDETEYGDETLSRSYWQTYYAPMVGNNGEIIGLTCFNLNITDKREQELQLHKLKAKLSAVISTIPDLIWVKDAEGVYMMCNPSFENFFGAECGEIIGKTDYDFISHEQADFFRQKDREALETGKMCINEEEIVFAKNGERALLETRKIPVYNGEEFMGVLGIGRDITERKKMELEIAQQKDFQNTLLVGIAEAGLGVHVIEEGRYIYTNDLQKAQKYGYNETIFDVKPNFMETIHPDDRAKALDMYARRLRGEDVPSTYELGVVQTDGVRREHSVSVIVIPNTDPIQTIVVTQDITERKVMEEMMTQKESRLKEAQKIAKVGSWELEFPGLNLSWSDEIYRIFEIDPKQFQPSYDHFLDAIHPEDRVRIDTLFAESLKYKTPYDIVHRLLMVDGRIKYVHERGETLFDEEGSPIRSIGTVQDITEQKMIEKKMEHMAHHDALTGLPNRTLAKERAEQVMTHAKRSKSQAAFLFIDLDGFKAINDSLGHSAGDTMLKTIAARLKECVRESDIISRQGGDEFLLILSDIKDENVIASTTQKILSALEKSFEINDHILSISGSIGISLYPDHGDNFELLLKSADTAMYKAKETGKNGYYFYTHQMTHNIIGQFKIQNDLKMALENNEFILFYQPQIDLATNRITGVEALIRWFHPQMGMIPPMSFIPIAESSGLIVSIGQWVIEEACRQAAIWHSMGITISVAVNISAMQFKRGNLEEIVKNALYSSKIDPKWLELELTESVIMHNTETTLECVHSLKRLGVQLSLDDFGTGYSSLSYLKRFAVDKLKIDQSFVRDILQDRDDAAIVKTIIQMAKNLNLKTIAEGVEDAQVLSVIDAYGCDEVQGYHFAKPMPAGELEEYHTNFYKSEA